MKKAKITYSHKSILFSTLLLMLVSICQTPLISKEINKPWLQGLDGNNLYVLVESDNSSDIELYYKNIDDLAEKTLSVKTKFYRKTNFGGSTYIHRFLLQNLKYGAEYEYWFEANKKYSFRLPNKEGEFTFTNMGDNRSGIKIWKQIAKNMVSENPDFMIFNGDLAYKKEYKYWVDEFFVDEAQTMFTKFPFYNAPGNHEGWNDNTKAFTQSTSISKEERPYYAFERGDALFFNS